MDLNVVAAAEEQLLKLLEFPSCDDAWLRAFVAAFPHVCSSRQRLFALLADVPDECCVPLQRAFGDAEGWGEAVEALIFNSADRPNDAGRYERPPVEDRRQMLRLIGYDWDARECATCASTAPPAISDSAGEFVVGILLKEIELLGWPYSCRPETLARACPSSKLMSAALCSLWERASDARLRKAAGNQFWTALFMATLGYLGALGVYLALVDVSGALAPIVSAAIPFLPTVWVVNNLISTENLVAPSRPSWRGTFCVAAIVGFLPVLTVIAVASALGQPVHTYSLIEFLSIGAGCTLFYAVAVRTSRPISLLWLLLVDPATAGQS